MSLINPAILFGFGLCLIPIVLHFLLRQKPKKLLFPALQLIQKRRKSNVRRLRLRHIWLMLLRIVILAALVLAIARPSLPAADYALSTSEFVTLFAIVGLAVVIYFATIQWWRHRRIPHHALINRRTYLRGGVGVGIALLLLLFVFWPYKNRVLAELQSPRDNVAENIPVAGVFLFDTSMSMEYKLDNKTRLDLAKEIAVEHLDSLPSQSQIAVASTAGKNELVFQTDLATARNRVKSLKIAPLLSNRIDDLVQNAIARHVDEYEKTKRDTSRSGEESADRFLREIYIFTDLSRSSWSKQLSSSLRQQLESLPWLQIYLIDVGLKEPQNVSISSLALSKETVARGRDLFLTAKLSSTSQEKVSRTVTLYRIDQGGKKTKKDQRPVAIKNGEDVIVKFALPALAGTVQQGIIQIEGDEPLVADNVRYFTVSLAQPIRTLLLTDSVQESQLWHQSLAPDELVRQKRAHYVCDEIEVGNVEQLSNAKFENYDVLFLINVAQPTSSLWEKLNEFVQQGGSLGVLLGTPQSHGQTKTAYDNQTARKLLPAELLAELPFTPPEFLDLKQFDHPLFFRFKELGAGDLITEQIRHYWRVKPFHNSHLIASFTDSRNSPAFIERTVGRGRVLMFTTDVAAKNWNDLPLSGWAFVALADQMTQYLAGRSVSQFNFELGDVVRLRIPASTTDSKPTLLRKPRGQVPLAPDGSPNQPRANRSGRLLIPQKNADQLGNYRILSNNRPARVISGFSLNLPLEQCNLTRLKDSELDEIFGEDRYQVATDIESLKRIVQQGRIGQEIFSLILIVLIVVFCGEHLVANRFYETDQNTDYRAQLT